MIPELMRLKFLLEALADTDLPDIDAIILDSATEMIPKLITEVERLQSIEAAARRFHGDESIDPPKKPAPGGRL